MSPRKKKAPLPPPLPVHFQLRDSAFSVAPCPGAKVEIEWLGPQPNLELALALEVKIEAGWQVFAIVPIAGYREAWLYRWAIPE
jgi:hypothetical protein